MNVAQRYAASRQVDRAFESAEKSREKEQKAAQTLTPLRSLQIQAVLLERERTRARIAEEERKKAEIALEALKARVELEKVRLQRMQATEASKTRREALKLRRDEQKHGRDQERSCSASRTSSAAASGPRTTASASA